MILWRGWPASNFPTTVFLVEWLVIFFVQSSGKQLATDFIIWLVRCSQFGIWHTKHWCWVLVLLPNTEVQNSSWRRVDVLTIFQTVLRGRFHGRLCTTFVEESFGFYFASRLAWFWLDFLRTEPLCLYLPFAKWWGLPRTHCSSLDGLWTPRVPTNSWSWRSWGQHRYDFLIYLRSRKFLCPLDSKTELCWVVFPCLDTGAISL